MGRIEVVAAILEDRSGRVLLSQRRPGKEYAGLWEFPGGKIEVSETPLPALQREAREELGIEIQRARRLMTVMETQGNLQIAMQVWRVHEYRGNAESREGQSLRWSSVHELDLETLPPLDRPIARALQLPQRMLVTPDPASFTRNQFLNHIAIAIAHGHRFIRLRCHYSPAQIDTELIHTLETWLEEVSGTLLLGSAEFAHRQSKRTGLHLRSAELAALPNRPCDSNTLLSTAVHHLEDLKNAERVSSNLLTISPIKATASHPEINGIGWTGFQALHKIAHAPAFALGGLTDADSNDALASGALGIAAIRAFWPGAV